MLNVFNKLSFGLIHKPSADYKAHFRSQSKAVVFPPKEFHVLHFGFHIEKGIAFLSLEVFY